ncbi:MAG: efflux RND transporter permease subunit [Kiritimatiellae bacterium]|nr:efflux RND transporter permease subunit [Kiritimatiellia bacterium]
MTDLKDKLIPKGPIAWMARNSVASSLMMVVLIVGGLFTGVTIKKEVFPDFELDFVTVSIAYPGASPEEVERGIVMVVEENLRGLEGVKEVTSRAQEGRASIIAEVLEGADRQKVYQDVQQEVSRITTFPEDAERPVVALSDRMRDVIDFVLYGDVPEEVMAEQAEIIRDRLLEHPGITQVSITGIRPYQITISPSQNTLRAHGLTLKDVAQRVNALAVELPGGGIKTTSGEILLRMDERHDYGNQFANLPVITTADGSLVRLRDIAEIKDGFDEESENFVNWNGKRAIKMDVYRVGDQTPLDVVAAVREVLGEVQGELPQGLKIQERRNRAKVYEQRFNLLMKNGAIGLVLVLLILGVFLEPRLAFWVMMGVPISFLGGLLVLPLFGVSFNVISMFAFLIALGIVVDDAIVVGENVFEHRQAGGDPLVSSILGTREVMMPVTFSALTNIVTFLPMLFLPGFIGKIWFVIPIVVNLVFLISLIECVFVLPSQLGGLKLETNFAIARAYRKFQSGFNRLFFGFVNRIYQPLLRIAVDWRYLVLASGLLLLIGTVAYVKSGRIGIVPMMSVDADYSAATAVLPYGAPVESTFKVRDRLIKSAEKIVAENGGTNLSFGVYADVGRSFNGVSGSHVVMVETYLTDPDVRPISTPEFTELWKKEFGAVAGIETLLFEHNRGGPGGGSSLSIGLSHHDIDMLEAAASELAGKLAEFPIVSDIDDGYADGKPQFNFKMLPEGLALGLTAADVARQVRYSFYGAEAFRQQRGRNEIKVMVRLPESERRSEYDLQNLLIRTPAGTDVPLRDVASATRGRAYTSINRLDGRRLLTVTANVNPRSESEHILGLMLKDVLPELKQKYPGLSQVFRGSQKDMREGLASLLKGFIAALLVVYALLAIPFRSYTQPLIIMACIPFGIVGAVLAHVMLGYPLSMISLMGIVALGGVVVNDSLVLVDYANNEVKRGVGMRESILNAGVRRFRPVLLTTLTTFLGLAPMIFETSRQARFMIPMAISLGFGILFATFITLFLVPALYVMVEDLHKAWGKIYGSKG